MNKKYKKLSSLLEFTINPSAATFQRYARGGLANLVSQVKDSSYGDHSQMRKGPYSKSYATGVGIPIASLLYTMYKLNKDRCDRHCRGNEDCQINCYHKIADKMTARINSDIQAANRIKDSAVKAKLLSKLQKELNKYQNMKKKIENRAAKN